jgi:hypothetical protein
MGWILLNVLIGVFTPLAGMGLMAAVNALTKNSKNKSTFVIDYFLPYRDGQLGYVAMAWCVGGLVELFRALAKQPNWLEGVGIALIGLIAIMNAFISALGASSPAIELPKPHTRRAAWGYYGAFRASVYLTFAALVGSAVIHYSTMPILGGTEHAESGKPAAQKGP